MMMSAARIENSLPSSKPVEDVAHRNLGPNKVFNALVDYVGAEKLGFSSSAVGRGSDVERVISDIATAFFNLSEDYHVLIASTRALRIPKEFKLFFSHMSLRAQNLRSNHLRIEKGIELLCQSVRSIVFVPSKFDEFKEHLSTVINVMRRKSTDLEV